MLLSINQEPRKILSGETLSLHASDQVRILEISTNILLNTGVRLSSEGFDVNALGHEEMSLSSLLPDRNIFEHYQFKIFIKYRNQDLGLMNWEIRPFAEDWLDMANRTIKDDQKIAVLENGLRVFPDDTRIWRSLLDEYKSQKKWKQAASMIEKAATKDPNQELLAELLEVYTEMSSKAKIVSILDKLIELDPNNLNLRLRLAEILVESKKYKTAIREYEALKKQVDKNERPHVHERLGFLYSKTGNHKKAISCYLDAIKTGTKDANIYYNLSYLYEKTKQPEQAYLYLEKAARLNSKDVDSRLVLAQRFLRKGDLKKAGQYVTEILKRNPSSLKALLLKARIAEQKGDKKELQRIYKKVISLDPKNDTAFYNLGVLYYESGDLKSGLTYLEMYIKKYPKEAAAHEIVFDIYKRQKDEKKAFEEAKIIVQLKPKKVEYYLFIFDYLNRQKAYGKMIPLLEKGVKSNPKNTVLRESLLYAYLKTGKEDQAVNQIDELLKINPGDVSLMLQMARLLEKQGKLNEAMEAYKKVVERSPDNEEAGEAYLRLRLKGVGK